MATKRQKKAEPKLDRSADAALPAAPNCVTIFGGGIAGLTAAHELVERGFRVQVWEPTYDERDPGRGCDVGGMARTQWSRVNWDEDNVVALPRCLDGNEWASRQTQAIRHLPWALYLDTGKEAKIIGAVGSYEAAIQNPKQDKARRAPAKSNPSSKDELDSGSGARKPDIEDDPGKNETIKRIIIEATEVLLKTPFPSGVTIYCESQRRSPVSEKVGRDRAQQLIDKINAFVIEVRAYLELGPVDATYAEYLTVKLSRIREGAIPTPGEPGEPPRWSKGDLQEVARFRITLLDDFPSGLPDHIGERLGFRVREHWIPGEHGFRFFPAFYHHLFDTMRRTPILEPEPKLETALAQERAVTVSANPDRYVETGRTVFDNLRPTTKQVIALHDGERPSVLGRSIPTSFEGVRDWIRLVLQEPPSESPAADPTNPKKRKGGFGFSARDLVQFELKTLQYLTSCDARRKDYEELSWLEYLGGDRAYTKRFLDVANNWPEALVSMDAKSSDARTQGSVFAQLLIDNFRIGGYRDGTLIGPSSVAWLIPWRRYLEAQGVEFIHGKITGFQRVQDPNNRSAVWPVVECYEPRYPGADVRQPALMPGYFLLALPALEAQIISRRYLEAVGKGVNPEGDLWRTAKFLQADDETGLVDPRPHGALRHMVGIQYYFDEDVYWLDGHFYMPLSKWGLSAISQVRFWQDKHDWEHGYRGVLSIVMTIFDEIGLGTDNTAWDSSPDEIAREVWAQLKHTLKDQKLPEPRYWHIDSGFRKDKDPKTGKDTKIYSNATPMLINLPGEWERRPGDLVPIEDDDTKLDGELSRYGVEQNIVLAGTFMKTYTRLTTMEAANESARHAVNAIIQHQRDAFMHGVPAYEGADPKKTSPTRVTPCDIWPIERREVRDFDFLKELDEELYARNLEHFLEILDLAEMVRTGLRGARNGIRDQWDPLSILTHLDRIVSSFSSKVTSVVEKESPVP